MPPTPRLLHLLWQLRVALLALVVAQVTFFPVLAHVLVNGIAMTAAVVVVGGA